EHELVAAAERQQGQGEGQRPAREREPPAGASSRSRRNPTVAGQDGRGGGEAGRATRGHRGEHSGAVRREAAPKARTEAHTFAILGAERILRRCCLPSLRCARPVATCGGIPRKSAEPCETRSACASACRSRLSATWRKS